MAEEKPKKSRLVRITQDEFENFLFDKLKETRTKYQDIYDLLERYKSDNIRYKVFCYKMEINNKIEYSYSIQKNNKIGFKLNDKKPNKNE